MRKLIASNHVLFSVIAIVFLSTIGLLTSSASKSSAESEKTGNQNVSEQPSDADVGQIYLPFISNTGKEQSTPTPQPNENTSSRKVFLPVVSRNGGNVPTSTPTPSTEPPIGNNPGYVSGVVYNSTSCDKHLTTCNGLAGASITLAKVDPVALAQVRAARKQQIVASGYDEPLAPLRNAGVTTPLTGTVLTRSDGSFDFPVNESGSYWLRVEKDGFTYAQREVELVVGHSTATNAIYLTPLDSKVTTCTSTGCTHTNSDGSIQLVIPAGAVPAGQSVDVTATNFKQVEYLPSGDLPEGTWETYAFNLGGDSEFAFQPGTTGTVRVKNDKGFNPGTRIPLGYWNQATQAWEHAGTGTVDASGQWIEMGVAHFSNYDCNDPISEPDIEVDTGGDDGEGPSDEPDEPCNGEEGCFINRKSGTLQEWIDLPPVNVLGENIAPQLRYSTDRVQPSEVIDIDLKVKGGEAAQIKHIGWELYIEGEKTDSFTFDAQLDNNGEAGRYRYLWDGRDAQDKRRPSGIYDYQIKLSIPYQGQYCYSLNGIFGNPPDCANGATGRFIDAVKDVWVKGTIQLDNRIDNSLGAGWGLSGLQRLYPQADGDILITNGDDSSLRFEWVNLLLDDNFDTENGGFEQFNYNNLLNWDVAKGSVDIIGNGMTFDLLPGHGLYIDLDGSTRTAGRVESHTAFMLMPGEYQLSFELAGSQRDAITSLDSVIVNMGSLYSETFTLRSDTPFTIINRIISVSQPTNVKLVFDSSVFSGDYYGLLLDTVKLKLITPSTAGKRQISLDVDSQANLFTSGHGLSSSFGGGIRPPGIQFMVHGGQQFIFPTITGTTTAALNICAFAGADGGEICNNAKNANVSSIGGISGIVHDDRLLFLAGVFINNREPVDPAPPHLTFSSRQDFTTLSPSLNQIFFIGDGKNGSGTLQEFIAPSQATRLFLGFVDSCSPNPARPELPGCYHDNSGSLVVEVEIPQVNGAARVYNSRNGEYSRLVRNPDNTYTRLYPDGTRVHFNANGYQENTLNPDGRKIIYTYNANGSLATMATATPNNNTAQWVWTFNYINSKLSSISDPAGRIITIQIDANGNLVQATLPNSSNVRFAYDNRHLLTKYTDPNDQVTDYTYDKYGRIATVIEPSRAVYNPTTGTTENKREVRTFTPSDTGYPLINDSPVGNPDAPAQAVPKSAQLIDRVVYGRGERSGHTNRWGSWLDTTDGLGRTSYSQRDAANNVTLQTYANGECAAYRYDANGNMLSETQMSTPVCTSGITAAAVAAGEVQTTTYTYEARFNQAKTAVDSLGRITSYIYDYEVNLGEAGHLVGINYPTIPDESGQLVTPTVSYRYNTLGLLDSETDLRGSVKKYLYTQGTSDEAFGAANARFAQGVTPEPGLLTQVIADYGGAGHLNLTTHYRNFDSQGNYQTLIDPRGNSTHTAYDAMGRKLSETDALGRVTKYEYDKQDNLVKRIEDYTSDGTTGRNIITTYSYDEGDRLLSERTVADGLTRETTYAYDIGGQLASERDPNGNITRYRYDNANQRIATIDPTGATTTYSYTVRGQIATITDPEGMVTRFEYDAFDRQVKQVVADGVLNLTTSYEYDRNNNLLKESAPDGVVTCYAYDNLNRRVSETRDCLGLKLTTIYTYNVAGDLIATQNERGIVTLNSYDPLGRMIRTRQDAYGLNLTNNYSYDANGNQTSTTDPRGTVTTFAYDVLNRRVSITQDANGMKLPTKYTYDRLNNQNSTTDPNETVTLTEYNAFGRPKRQVEDANGLAVQTLFAYDNNLNLLSITDNNNNTTTYTYNGRNQRTQTRFADQTTIKLSYSADGTLATRTDQANVKVTYTYDKAHRLVSKTYPDGSAQIFSYDAMGRMTEASQTMSSHTTRSNFAYNALSDVISSTQSVDNLSWNITYSYNYQNGSTTTQYPSGTAVTHQPDAINRLQQVKQDDGVIATYTHNDATGTISLLYNNGITSKTETDPLYRVTQISIGKTNQTSFADYRYGYDKVGNRTYLQRTHKAGTPADVYQYDGLYQLKKVWYGANAITPATITAQNAVQVYQFDTLGNRLSLQNNSTSQSYLPNNGQKMTNSMNRYESVDGKAFSYDAKGNTLNDGRNTYTYDYENRQIGMIGAGGTATYLYNALGHRVAKIVNGTQVNYIYNNRYQLLEERNASNSLSARYLYGEYIDEPLQVERNNVVSTYHHDAQYNISEVTNPAGSVIERYEYDLYGGAKVYDAAFVTRSTSAISNTLLYTGRGYDPETGNYDYRTRIYSPQLGRFLQTDSAEYADGLNVYGYVKNNPANFTDPNGLFGLSVHAMLTDQLVDRALRSFPFRSSQIFRSIVKDGNLSTDTTISQFDHKKHYDNSSFADGDAYIVNAYRQIQRKDKKIDSNCCNSPNNRTYIFLNLMTFGGILHTTQDFYAHSNWIEMQLGVNGWTNKLISGDTKDIWAWPWEDQDNAWWNTLEDPTTHAHLNKDGPGKLEGSIVVRGRTLHDYAVEYATFATQTEFEEFQRVAPNTLKCLQSGNLAGWPLELNGID